MGAISPGDSETHGGGVRFTLSNNSALQKQIGVCISIDSWL